MKNTFLSFLNVFFEDNEPNPKASCHVFMLEFCSLFILSRGRGCRIYGQDGRGTRWEK